MGALFDHIGMLLVCGEKQSQNTMQLVMWGLLIPFPDQSW